MPIPGSTDDVAPILGAALLIQEARGGPVGCTTALGSPLLVRRP
jgi:hypothetical protein